MRLITKNCELFRADFGWKTPLGSDFFDFSLPKNSPHHSKLTGGKKKFDISRLSMWYQWGDHHLT